MIDWEGEKSIHKYLESSKIKYIYNKGVKCFKDFRSYGGILSNVKRLK